MPAFELAALLDARPKPEILKDLTPVLSWTSAYANIGGWATANKAREPNQQTENAPQWYAHVCTTTGLPPKAENLTSQPSRVTEILEDRR